MAYGQNPGQGQKNYYANRSSQDNSNRGGSGSSGAQAPEGDGEKKLSNNAGIAYEKTSTKGMKYFSVTIMEDLPKGTKLSMFLNDLVKNKTAKTPTHVLKHQKKQEESK